MSLAGLPALQAVTHAEVLAFVSRAGLGGAGIGYVDAHLLAAVSAAPDKTLLWTRDRRLARVARRLALAAELDEAKL